ncbi:MAG: hypothetical protein EXR72_08765 [Myxococcales bacterium]|nr:hypothetical protein [Myxococcales bacterium]
MRRARSIVSRPDGGSTAQRALVISPPSSAPARAWIRAAPIASSARQRAATPPCGSAWTTSQKCARPSGAIWATTTRTPGTKYAPVTSMIPPWAASAQIILGAAEGGEGCPIPSGWTVGAGEGRAA